LNKSCQSSAHLDLAPEIGARLERGFERYLVRRLRNKAHAHALRVDDAQSVVLGQRVEQIEVRPADIRQAGGHWAQRREHLTASQPVGIPEVGHAVKQVRSVKITFVLLNP
jgi:hypothetical protein